MKTQSYTLDDGEQLNVTSAQAALLLTAGLIYDTGDHHFSIMPGHSYAEIELTLKGSPFDASQNN